MAQKYIDIKFVNQSSKGIPDEVIKLVQNQDFTYNQINDSLDEYNLRVLTVEVHCLDEYCEKANVTITIGDK